MFCIYCGTTVEEGVKACPKCGSTLLVLESPKETETEKITEENTEDGRDIYSSAPHRFREEPEMEDISSGKQIELPRDEYNMAGNEQDPQNVPYNDGYDYEEYASYDDEEPAPRVWPKVLAIIAAVLVVLGAGVGIFLWQISPAKKFDRAVKAIDYIQIVELLPELKEEKRMDAAPQMRSFAADAVYQYNEGELDYRPAHTLTAGLAENYPGDAELQAAKEEIEALKASKDVFMAAVDAEKMGEKAEALRLLQEVIESDSNFITAQEHIAAIRSEYKSEIIKRAEELSAEEDFEGAYAVLQEGSTVLGEDADISNALLLLADAEKEAYIINLLETAQTLADEEDYIGAVQLLEEATEEDARFAERIEFYKKQYREQFMKEAEAYVKAGDYEEAVLTLEGAKDFLKNDREIEEKIKEYKELLPAMLIDMEYTGGSDCSGVASVTGADGSTYANGLHFALAPDATTKSTTYTPDGKFKRLSGTWIIESESTPGFIGKICIYVDGSMQYELTSMTVNSSGREMNLLIDGAKEIRIEAEGTFTGEEEVGYIYFAGAVFRN